MPELPASNSQHPVPAAPALSPLDSIRLNAWFDHRGQLPDLARALNITTTQLADWAAQPHIAAAIARIEDLANQRAAYLHLHAQHDAIERLLDIVKNSKHEETARRAADRLLRPLGRVTADPANQPARPPRTNTPSRLHTPRPQRVLASPPPTNNHQATPPSPPTPAPASSDPFAPSDLSPSPTPSASSSFADQLDACFNDDDDFDAELEDELQSIDDDPDLDDDDRDEAEDSAEDRVQDRILDRQAARFERTFGVPLSHPEVLNAIAEQRIGDLQHIITRIREQPRAPT
ncbi:hypothetical protein PHYC_00376 [Phycisphaerales bacterium]|nr:hypothetical protein PHYC_00376 [Phycisphaerales bacterium]